MCVVTLKFARLRADASGRYPSSLVMPMESVTVPNVDVPSTHAPVSVPEAEAAEVTGTNAIDVEPSNFCMRLDGDNKFSNNNIVITIRFVNKNWTYTKRSNRSAHGRLRFFALPSYDG